MPVFFTVWCRFFSRFIRDINGEKKKTSRCRWTFSQLVFHGLPPLEFLGACATTTKFLDNKIFPLKIILSWRFPRKKKNSVFGRLSSLPPRPPPPLESANFIFIVVSPSLKIFERNFPQKPGLSDSRPMNHFEQFWWDHCRKPFIRRGKVP